MVSRKCFKIKFYLSLFHHLFFFFLVTSVSALYYVWEKNKNIAMYAFIKHKDIRCAVTAEKFELKVSSYQFRPINEDFVGNTYIMGHILDAGKLLFEKGIYEQKHLENKKLQSVLSHELKNSATSHGATKDATHPSIITSTVESSGPLKKKIVENFESYFSKMQTQLKVTASSPAIKTNLDQIVEKYVYKVVID